MTSQVRRPSLLDFPLLSDMSDSENSPESDLKKKIPKELTAQGTTPSGKPRLFVCNTCTRAFARLEHLRRHERSHTKEKPFTCGICQRKFSRRDLLLRHAQKLHAGCSDAISRIRRKLIKSSMNSDSHDVDNYMNEQSDSPGDPYSLLGLKVGSFPTPSTSHRGSVDSVLFNLNSFSGKDISATANTALRGGSNSLKDPSIQKHLFDRRKAGRIRGASFSAQSGANYASTMHEYPDSYPADSVEFSTPQLHATSTADENSWLSNLSTIPGMSQSSSSLIKNDQFSLESEIPTHTSVFGVGLASTLIRADSQVSHASVESAAAKPPFRLNSTDMLIQSAANTPQNDRDAESYGYSFYDIPDSMASNQPRIPRMNGPLSPIKQELDDELMDIEGSVISNKALAVEHAITDGVNFNLNFLNDFDNLTQDFDVSSKFHPNGYSFYGDNPLVSSSGIDSTSPPPLMSPSSMGQGYNKSSMPVNTLGYDTHDLDHLLTLQRVPETHRYNKKALFTKNMRHLINKALCKYPISGIMSPSIPSNEKLEFFLQQFTRKFLSHFPFIHPSKLNEHEVMTMTSNEDASNESARVCMPLLVATIGALLASEKNDAENLYEASRRAIHIYLESRKNSVSEYGTSLSNTNINPLWLIQSLILSVIYGLFSDNENNVYIVIRQLNALNSLVKTSIKSGREVLFSMNPEDELFYNEIKNSAAHPLSNREFDSEIKFKNSINKQSQVRIVLSIYKLTNFILMMYNVPLTLSLNDLESLLVPNVNDEFLWEFYDYEEFQKHSRSQKNPKDLSFYLSTNEANTIAFKDLLICLMRRDFNPSVVAHLSNISKMGLSAIVQGIFEVKQYEEMKNVNISAILDTIAVFINNLKFGSNQNHQLSLETPTDYEKMNFTMMVSFVKITSSLDFKLVKEQSWLRNYEELTRNYHKFLLDIDKTEEDKLVSVIDNCILIIKLALFRSTDADNEKRSLVEQFLRSGQLSENFGQVENSGIDTSLGVVFFDEIDSSKCSIVSQMLFHVFVIFSTFAIHIAKRNRGGTNQPHNIKITHTAMLNQRFVAVLSILGTVELFLKTHYLNINHEHEITSLSLLLSNGGFDKDAGSIDILSATNQNGGHFDYNLEKSIYVLKIGELTLSYLYDTNIKVCIFKKLSASLSLVRRFLIDGESMILP